MNVKQQVICRKIGNNFDLKDWWLYFKLIWNFIINLHAIGLHGNDYEPTIVPNTPHFNRLLWEIKGSISLRPVKFLDKIPEEADLGACKINHFTGEFRVNPIYRVGEERLNYEPLALFEGRYLRNYLKKLVGVLAITTKN